MTPKKSNPELDAAIREIAAESRKDYGDGVIMSAGAAAKIPITWLPTGVPSVDAAMGGGFMKGRMFEVFGGPGDGKTTLLLKLIAECQKSGFRCGYIDAEHKLYLPWAALIGVDLDALTLINPDHGEHALDIAEKLVLAGIDLLIIDSVAALVPKAELEGEMADSNMGLQARMLSKAMRKLSGPVSKFKTCLIFINQMRQKIGIVYGNPNVTTSGKGLEFYSSTRLEIRKKEQIKEGDTIVGRKAKLIVVKNQIGAPGEETDFDIYSGKCKCHAIGIDIWANLLDLAVARGIVEKSGTWLSFAGEKIGQGRENASAFLQQHQDWFDKIRESVMGAK